MSETVAQQTSNGVTGRPKGKPGRKPGVKTGPRAVHTTPSPVTAPGSGASRAAKVITLGSQPQLIMALFSECPAAQGSMTFDKAVIWLNNAIWALRLCYGVPGTFTIQAQAAQKAA